jgi:hypothetical protein
MFGDGCEQSYCHRKTDAANQARYGETTLMATAELLTTGDARSKRYVFEGTSESSAASTCY